MSPATTTFQSFHERNYKLFFIGQTVSQCGNWLQTMALAWLVLDLSHKSGLAVGLSVALQFVPTLLLSVWAGVLADRFDKRKLLVVANVAMAAIAVFFLVLDLTGVVQLWMIYVIVFVYGIFFALDYPTRQAFVPEMVTAADLPNAIGLSSASLQSARIIGPAIAGATIVLVGTSVCFALNAVSYVVVLGALFMMRPAELHRGTPVKREPGQIREGFRYMWSTPELRATLLMLVVVGTLAINSPVILPLMARIVFDGNADVYSWLTIAMGAGALVGALLWARRPQARAELVVLAGFAYGVLILLAAVSPSLAVFLAVLVVVGAAQTWFLAASSSLVQLTAEPSMRGRVMAVYTLAVVGSTPIGGPIIGWLSEQFGPRWAYAVGGIATLAACVAFGPTLLRSRRRRNAALDTDVVLGVDGEAIPRDDQVTDSSTFQSLHVRNYRLLFFGQWVSQCGTWMQTIALSWLVLDLSHQSGVAVGFAVALQYLPTLLLVVYAGALADRFDKRKLLIITDSSMATLATLLFVLALTGVVQLWMIYVVVFVYGIAFAIDSPARQAFVPELVPASDLPNAIGLNSASTQVARVLGPAVGGLVVVTVGTSACFGLNVLSYVCVIVTYLLMRSSELHRGAPVRREPRQIRDGFRYMWHTTELRITLLVLVMVGTFAINSPVILPLMARNVFGGDAEVFSWMTIGMGSGALVGALVWARRPRPRGDVLLLAGFAYGVAIIVASASPELAVFLGLLVVVGAMQTWFLSAAMSLVQLTSVPNMRGRVMAVFTLAVVGTTPIGGPIIGALSAQFGARWAYAFGGAVAIAAVLVFARTMLRVSRAARSAEAEADADVVLGVDGEVIPASISEPIR